MPAREQSFVSVASYNVLCDAYIRPEFYPRCDPAAFRPDRRHPLLLERVAGLGTDIICLQEVDAEMYERLKLRLEPDGYRGRWTQKTGGKPDGCATFVRNTLRVTSRLRQVYHDSRDGRPASGHVAQTTTLVMPEGHALVVVNTHLKRDAPETPLDARYGLAQAKELVAGADRQMPFIICGDFNAEHQDETMQVFVRAGFHDAHLGNMTPTCVPNGVARKIDAILCNSNLLIHDFSSPSVDATALLPSAAEPSDHVPICATFVTTDD